MDRLISAERLKAHYSWWGDDPMRETFDQIVDQQPTVEAIPAADVVPVRHGRWIEYRQGRWVYAKCSKCETVHDVRTNYCPNCGDKMNGGADDEND